MNPFNLYGDNKNPSIGGRFGVDIALQRADDLDTMAILHAYNHPGARALDAASAGGGQALRLAQVGANTLAIDIEDYSLPFLAAARQHKVENSCQFIQCDLRNYNIAESHAPFDIVVCQRMLHYVPFSVAVEIVKGFYKALTTNGCLYVSASGIASELGNGYTHKETQLASRYTALDPLMMEKHAIHGPVCLYSETDMAFLLESAGFTTIGVFSSLFGNVKAVGSR